MRNVMRTGSLRVSLWPWLAAGIFCFALLSGLPARAQQTNDQEQPGIESGNYLVRQSVEFGFRFADVSGNRDTYDTFVNLHQGPRLLDFTTEMTSLNHHATLFDRLYLSNFGYGGDPNNVSRLRISKDKWYDFDALFRRDINSFDYSLLANPLNPVSPPFANAPAGFSPIISNSPHMFDTVRRMGSYDLMMLPQSKVRFRLGYSRNIAEGPSLTTYHQGTEALLFQQWKTTVNDYRFGVDFNFLPRTNFSYDQFWSYYKGDTGITDLNQTFALSNGTPVDIGISLNAGAGQPCSGTFTATGAVNPACNAYLSFFQHGRTRTSQPTEQFSFQSQYFKKLDLSGRFSYTGGDLKLNNFDWMFAGDETRSRLRNGSLFGPASSRRVAATTDFGATFHATNKLSFLDSFHFNNFHDPGVFDASSCSFYSPNLLTSANVFNFGSALPVVCTPPSDGVSGTPAHSSSSGADLSLTLYSNFLKQDEKTNLFEVDYQFTPRYGARVGYRFRHRAIDDSALLLTTEVFFPSNANRGDCALVGGMLPAGCVSIGNGSFEFTTPGPVVPGRGETIINEHSGLLGFWARPTDKWRVSFDSEIMSADNAFTRISPRQRQEYRVRSTYKPVEWVTFTSSMYIWEARDNVVEVDNKQHNRAFGFGLSLEPNSKFSVDLGYDYNNVFSTILVCYTSSTAPAGLAKCPGSTVLVEQQSVYRDKSHFGYFSMVFRPIKPVTTRFGTNITVTNGSALLINPNAPPGTLNSHYYLPFAGIDYNFAKYWTARGYWGYYGYHEDETAVPQDVFVPRLFHGNLETISLRFAF